MTIDEKRLSAGRRSSKDRRSGVDTRTDEERLSKERRSKKDRRSGLDRRSSVLADASRLTGDRDKP
jgi:hypothetical protein